VTLLSSLTDLTPSGDQPEAIDALVTGVERGDRFQTLLGITGSGKSFTIANVIARPTGRRSDGPTRASPPSYGRAAEMFPKTSEYFVSYYDTTSHGLPPTTGHLHREDSSINDGSTAAPLATSALLSRAT